MPDAAEFAYVATIGRRSGRPHVIEIWYVTRGGTHYVMSGGRERSDWVRNILANPAVTVRLGGPRELTADGGTPALARVVEAGTDEDADVRALMLARYASPADDLVEWGRTALVVALSPLARR